MTRKKTEPGMIAGAHPTAPGGMSQKALAAELIEKHGWTKENATFPMSMWTDQINAVIAERKMREREQKAEANRAEQASARIERVEKVDVNVLFTEPEADDDDLDPDALMAELLAERDDADSETEQHSHRLLVLDPHTLDYTFDGHAGAGPSGAERWMHCTMSLGASRAFLETLTPNQQQTYADSGEAARQGTTAHAAAEIEALAILGKVEQAEVDATLLELAVEPPTEGEAYDDEMAEYITEYTDLIKTYAQERGDDHVLIEARVTAGVPLTGMHEGEVYEINGSADAIIMPDADDPHPMLVVADLKYGNGIDVDVDSNPQVRIYALGALGLLVNDDGSLITDVEMVGYHIVQPRLGGIKTWEEPLDDLLQWRDEVLAPALTAALYGVNEGATYAPSDAACQFCPARGGCPALAADRVEKAAHLFDTVVEAEFSDGPGAFPETVSLDDAELGRLLAQIIGLIDIHKDLKAEAERRLLRGTHVPGFKLVNYPPPRKWKDNATEVLPVEDNPALYTHKLLTPAAIEKGLGAEVYAAVEDLIEKPDKRPVIAREGDRRKTWEGKPPEAMFADETGDE